MHEDEKLWMQIVAGDGDAYGGWYQAQAPRLKLFLRHLLNSEQAAEDVMQETFTQIWRRPVGFAAERGSLRAWLFGAARKRAADWKRKQKPEQEFVDEPSAEQRAEQTSIIADAIAKLPAEQRSLLWLREVDGYSYQELAEIWMFLSALSGCGCILRGKICANFGWVRSCGQEGKMNCADASEFVSALYDAESIPLEAAQHIGACSECQKKLRDYAALGAGLRCFASMEKVQSPAPRTWARSGGVWAQWWQQSMQTMRIPRVAFALLVLCLVLAGTRLVLVGVGAEGNSNATEIKVDLGAGMKSTCYLQSAPGSRATICGFVGKRASDQKTLGYEIRLKGFDGKRFQLGIRAAVFPVADADKPLHEVLNPFPLKEVWFVPGKSTKVDFADGLTMLLQGEWTEHVPPYMAQMGNPRLDPNVDELRISSPLLLKDKVVMGDFEGGGSNSKGEDDVVVLYYPKGGLMILSLKQLPDAVIANVRDNRIRFTANGHEYTLLNAAPITRAEQIWVVYKPDYKPAAHIKGSFLGNPREKELADFLQKMQKER